MELVEQIKDINYYLQREFGVHEDGRARFRVVFSNDQYEKRKTFFTPEGLELLHPEVKELPKYQHVKDRYVLEQLSIVPEGSEIFEKLSYEPLWVFQDRFNNYLPPRFDVSKIVIEQMYFNMMHKHAPKKEDSEEIIRKKQKELQEVEEKLFGNETPVADGLAYGWSSTVPGHDDQTKLGGKPSKANVLKEVKGVE